MTDPDVPQESKIRHVLDCQPFTPDMVKDLQPTDDHGCEIILVENIIVYEWLP